MSCTAKVTGKRFNHGEEEGLEVSCILQFIGEKKFLSTLEEQLILLKEKLSLYDEIVLIFSSKFELSGKFLSRGQEKRFDLTNVRVIGGSSYREIYVTKC